MSKQLCSWTGEPCDCIEFPYKNGGMIPLACESRIKWGLIPVRAVGDPLKKLWVEFRSAVDNGNYDPENPEHVEHWERCLRAAKNKSAQQRATA